MDLSSHVEFQEGISPKPEVCHWVDEAETGLWALVRPPEDFGERHWQHPAAWNEMGSMGSVGRGGPIPVFLAASPLIPMGLLINHIEMAGRSFIRSSILVDELLTYFYPCVHNDRRAHPGFQLGKRNRFASVFRESPTSRWKKLFDKTINNRELKREDWSSHIITEIFQAIWASLSFHAIGDGSMNRRTGAGSTLTE